MRPQSIDLERADSITIGTIGPPGQRAFFLQAVQDELLVTLTIEKEQATALAVAIGNSLERLRGSAGGGELAQSELLEPVEPLFRVGQLQLGYDQQRDMLVIIAEELVAEEGQEGARVRIWAGRAQMAALARTAILVAASGRPVCPLCHEVMEPDEKHVCTRGNGRKRL